MFNLVIGFVAGAVVALIGAFFYIRNNRAQFEAIQAKLEDTVAEAKSKIKELESKVK